MRRPLILDTAALALLVAACGGNSGSPESAAARPPEEPRPPATDSVGPGIDPAPPQPADTPPVPASFEGTTAPTDRPRPAVPPATLVAVRTAAHDGYDRVVFEFSGERVPGYRIDYAARPLHQCGSGRELARAGNALLRVRIAPARAHDDHGRPTVEERDRSPGLANLKTLTLTCDFEGMVEWVLGLAAADPYRTLERTAPPRLVVDVQR